MKKRSNRTIYGALPIVAAAYGEKFGVKVVIAGDQAYTDGNTIVIPNVPADYRNVDVVWGYLAHEAAHVRFTDFSVARYPGIHAELSNILEDCRIERAMIEAYPGTAQTLNEVACYMAQAGHYEHVNKESHPGAVLSAFCLYWLQSQAVGQKVLEPYLETAKAALATTFPVGVVTRLHALLRKAVGTRSTAEVVSLVEAILEMLADERKEQQVEPPSASQHDGDQSQQQGDLSASVGGGPEDRASGGPSGSQQQKTADAGRGELLGDRGGRDERAESAKDTQRSETAAEAIRQALCATPGDLLGDAHQALKADLMQSANDGDSRVRSIRHAVEIPRSPEGQRIFDSVKKTTSKIRNQLYGLVQASQRTGYRNMRAGKRVDSSRLHRLTQGDLRIFRTSADRKKPYTAVHILVDMSSSMSNPSEGVMRAGVAREAAMAIAVALETIPGVNPAVTYFGGSQDEPVFSAVKHGASVSANVGRFAFKPRGRTPMAEALWYGAFELSKTPEERKLLVVVTDGEPDPGTAGACNHVIELCNQSKIDVVGIGIGTQSVAKHFTNHVIINDVMELKGSMFKLMARSLAI